MKYHCQCNGPLGKSALPGGTLNEPVIAIRASTQVLHENVSAKSMPYCAPGYHASRLDQVRNVAEEIKWVTRNQTQSGVFGI